jgi:glycerate kinase
VSIRVLIAPSGFKESLGAEAVAEGIAAGVRRAVPDAKVALAPLVDGGEGTTRTLVAATGGTLHPVVVTGPVGDPVSAHVGLLGGEGPRTAVVEMAAAAGLRLVPRDRRDPLRTTTFGVGELIAAALDLGAERILVGCGDSGTNDGGAGLAQALGVRLLDADGRDIGRGGAELSRLDRIDRTGLDPRLAAVKIDVALNWHNVLCGPRGVARVFGPQKGASPQTVAQLEQALEHFASVVYRDLGTHVHDIPGGGASGGLGAGLHAFLRARLHPRYDVVMRYLDFDALLDDTDLVLTAEGSIDAQTPYGKIPAEVARRAKAHGLPVIALAGTIGEGAEQTHAAGIDAYASILQAPCSLEEAMGWTSALLASCSEQVMRVVSLGIRAHRAEIGLVPTTP